MALNNRFFEKVKEKITFGNNQNRIDCATKELKKLMNNRSAFIMCYNSLGIVGDTIVACDSQNSKVYIPAVINGHPIKRIGSGAFLGCEKVKSIVIEEGIEEIGEKAFFECKGLKTITFPSSLKKIDKRIISAEMKILRLSQSIAMDRTRFEYLVSSSINTNDGRVFLNRDGIKQIGIDNIIGGCQIAEDFPEIFDKEMRMLFTTTEIIAFEGLPEISTEKEVVNYMMKHMREPIYSEKAELANDRIARSYFPGNSCEKVKLAFFDKKQVKKKTNQIMVTIHFYSTVAFFPVVKKMTVNEVPFFVYEKNFLSANPECPIRRGAHEIYASWGKIERGRDFALVESKYRFLELLE